MNGVDAMFSLLPRKRGRDGRHGADSSIMHVLIIACNSDYVVVCVVARFQLRWDAVQCSHALGFSSHTFSPGRGYSERFFPWVYWPYTLNYAGATS